MKDCIFFARGVCNRGDLCSFRHGDPPKFKRPPHPTLDIETWEENKKFIFHIKGPIDECMKYFKEEIPPDAMIRDEGSDFIQVVIF
jgi:hypothetical protein